MVSGFLLLQYFGCLVWRGGEDRVINKASNDEKQKDEAGLFLSFHERFCFLRPLQYVLL